MPNELEMLVQRSANPARALPKCQLCGGNGFTGCPVDENGGFVLSKAAASGVACFCPAGAEFAVWQADWMGPILLDEEHQAEREGHEIETETRNWNGRLIERRRCSCGWTGQWIAKKANAKAAEADPRGALERFRKGEL